MSEQSEDSRLPQSWGEYRLLVLSNLNDIRTKLDQIQSEHKSALKGLRDEFEALKLEVEVQKTKIAFAGVIAAVVVSVAVSLLVNALSK